MELYFKDLISKDASLEKLVDDLTLLVHGADDYAKAVGEHLPEESRREIASRLDRLKNNCRQIKQQMVSGARATDKLVRRNPYSAFMIALVAGVVLGLQFCRRK
jgi:ElaB/YqjD/DUF883 family membrane-anchored ribosome-binding protein